MAPPNLATERQPRAPDAFGQWSRRRLLSFGGVSILTSVALAACSSGSSRRPTTTLVPPTTAPPSPDVPLLRLASSLEHLIVVVYNQGEALLHTAEIKAASDFFKSHHHDHASAFERATADAGGQPFTQPNAAVLQSLAPRVAALKTEADVVKLVYDLEVSAAATCFSSVGTLTDVKLDPVVMSVGATEARHVAVLGMMLSGLPAPIPGIAVRSDSPPYPAVGVQTGAGGVAPGTGV